MPLLHPPSHSLLFFFFSLSLALSLALPARASVLPPAHVTADAVLGTFTLLPSHSSSNCPTTITHLAALSLEDAAVPHIFILMDAHPCNDGASTIVHGSDAGAASAAVQRDAKALVNAIITSALPFWLASEPDGRTCGPARLRNGTLVAVIRNVSSPANDNDNDNNNSTQLLIPNMPLAMDSVYMLTSSLDEQCYFERPLSTTSPISTPVTPSPSPVPLPVQLIPDVSTQPVDDDIDDQDTSTSATTIEPETEPEPEIETERGTPPPTPAPSRSSRPPTFAVPPPETPEPDGGGDGAAACFPGWATAYVLHAGRTAMHSVRVGDYVLVADGSFSPVFALSHASMHARSASFVRLTTSDNASVTLTSSHYLVPGLPAGMARRGDRTLRKGVVVKNVKWLGQNDRWGLYNPHTIHGSIVVDGVPLSTYSKHFDIVPAHALLAPIRAAFKACARSSTAKTLLVVPDLPLVDWARSALPRLLVALRSPW